MANTIMPSTITANRTNAAVLPTQSTPRRFTIFVSRNSKYFGKSRDTNKTKISVNIIPLTKVGTFYFQLARNTKYGTKKNTINIILKNPIRA